MLNGILIGVGGMVLLGAIVSLADPEGREVLAKAVVTILLIPVIPAYLLLRWLIDRQDAFQVRTLSNDTLRRFVDSSAYRGVIVHRKGRAYIVLTDPKVWKRNKINSPDADGVTSPTKKEGES